MQATFSSKNLSKKKKTILNQAFTIFSNSGKFLGSFFQEAEK